MMLLSKLMKHLSGVCPIHEGKCQIIETAHEFSCIEREEERALGEKRPQGFYFPRLLCKREISREEVAHYLIKW